MQSVKESQKFQRVVVTREEALSMFEENKFKVWGMEGKGSRSWGLGKW